MNNVIFWSEDQRFSVRIANTLLEKMYDYCHAASQEETGGILVGRYTAARDCAMIEIVTPPPVDSRHGATTFLRGIRGLKQLLKAAQQENGSYYLGEWHYHPNSMPHFSSVDADQMKRIAGAASYNCPEPILLIVGGSASGGWLPAAYVFPRASTQVTLYRANGVSR